MAEKTLFLKCSVSSGMFRDEFAVKSKSIDGKIFSLFINENFVKRKPTGEDFLVVDLYNSNGKSIDVLLPVESFELGKIVSVAKDQVVESV